MQSLLGVALICAVVLIVMAVRQKPSGQAPHFMSYPAMDEAFAVVLTVAAAFGIILATNRFTPFF